MTAMFGLASYQELQTKRAAVSRVVYRGAPSHLRQCGDGNRDSWHVDLAQQRGTNCNRSITHKAQPTLTDVMNAADYRTVLVPSRVLFPKLPDSELNRSEKSWVLPALSSTSLRCPHIRFN
jgi:hypothetical protein